MPVDALRFDIEAAIRPDSKVCDHHDGIWQSGRARLLCGVSAKKKEAGAFAACTRDFMRDEEVRASMPVENAGVHVCGERGRGETGGSGVRERGG